MSPRLYAGPYCLIAHKATQRYAHIIYPTSWGAVLDSDNYLRELTPDELDALAGRYRKHLARSLQESGS